MYNSNAATKERIAQLIASMRQMNQDRPVWQPTEHEPVAVIHERQDRENRLRSIATQIVINGGQVRQGIEDGNY